MSEIETLTEDERTTIERHFAEARADELRGSFSDPLVDEELRKLLRIHDAQAKRIAELEPKLAAAEQETQHVMAHRSRMQKRIVDLEAQVLASETVSKAEYDAMVKQRDTMREDRKTARILLEDALGWLRAHEATLTEDVPEELTWLIGAIEALPPFRV